MSSSVSSPAPRSFRDRWNGFGKGPRALLVILVIFIAANVVLSIIDSATRGADETSPASSSLSTGSRGLAAYSSLLRHFGISVRQQRGSIDDATLDPSATLVLLDPGSVGETAAHRLRQFVEHGGRLVAGGSNPRWLDSLVTNPPTWSSDARRHYPAASGEPEQRGFHTVQTDAEGSWQDPGGAAVIAGTADDSLALATNVGSGRLILLADSTPLQNALLDHADNAGFAVSIVGGNHQVVFAEGVHGFGNDTGLAAIPTRWKLAIALTLLAALLLMLAQGRVIGGPEEVRRSLPPARGAYVTALAQVIQGSKQPGLALAPLQARARADLGRRLGLAPDVGDDEFRRVATNAGWTGEDLDALLQPAGDRRSVLAVGRAWAHIEGENR
jgi:hypothetical protein